MDVKSTQEVSVVNELVAKAIETGADFFEVEYKDGYEEVCAFKGVLGSGIARFKADSNEACSLRDELNQMRKKGKRIPIGDQDYKIRVDIYESFGEDVFRVRIKTI